MICNGCNKERSQKDFLFGDICYKCVYQHKLTVMDKQKVCKICKSSLPNKRWTYCSDECYEQGMKRQRKNYWTRNMTAPLVDWKNPAGW